MAKFRIAHIASEVAPFAKTGGLADVVGALPKAQERAGHKVSVFMPYFREVRKLNGASARPVLKSLPVHLAPGFHEEVGILEAPLPGTKVPVYLVDNPKAYDRDHLYGTPDGDYHDNADRFILLCRAVLQTIKELKEEFDIIHCHDWQTALVPAHLARLYADDPAFARTATVFTFHNMAYQGVFPKDTIVRTGLGWEAFTPEQLEFYGKVNFMKAGLLYAHQLVTVSPTYSREVLTPEFGCGLEGLLRTRTAELSGILNGIDNDEWDPSRDPHLAAKYSRRNPAGKAECRAALRAELGLPAEDGERVMLIAAIARLAEQKGFDLIADALPQLAKRPVQIVVLGHGERAIAERLEAAMRDHGARLKFVQRFDHPLAHRLYAAADALLMPSRFEPCGLGQLIAMRYATLPIVHGVGGLADTVRTYAGPRKPGWNGFAIKAPTPEALVKSVDEALAVFKDEAAWKKAALDAMAEDFSWTASAKLYDGVYARAQRRRNSGA